MRKLWILTVLAGFLMFGIKTNAQEPYVIVKPTPLEVRGGMVSFTADIFVPKDKVMKEAGTYVVKPELGDHKFEVISIPASKLGDMDNKGISTTIEASIPFNEEMIGNDLEIEHEYEYNGKKKEFEDMDQVGDCCITTGMLFVMNSQYEMSNVSYSPASTVPLKWVGQINFPVDISKYSGKEHTDEIKGVGEYLKKYPNSTITISGFASPEGPYERNRELSQERAQVAKDWLVDQLTAAGYGAQAKKADINVETTTEDWEGFQMTLERSDLSEQQQEEIEEIVSAGLDPKTTEARVLAVGGGEQKMEPFLAPLRRTTIVVESPDAKREGYDAEEIDSVLTAYNAGSIPTSALEDIFNQEEYLKASQSNEEPAGKLTMLMGYYEHYPEDMRVYSDLGAMTAVDLSRIDVVGGDDALVGIGFDRDLADVDQDFVMDDQGVRIQYVSETGEMEIDVTGEDMADSEEMLKKAYDANNNDFVASNNLGAYYLAQDKPDMAVNYLTKSVSVKSTNGNNYNMGLYYAGRGDYNKALKHFEKATDVDGMEYNRGLAKLMNGDIEGAKADLMKFTKEHPNVAIGHYVMAIAGARSNDVKTMTTHLKEAIALNKRLSDISQEDLEFRNYWENELFQEASDDDPAH